MAETLQETMTALLVQSGIPAKEIKVFGGSIIVKCWSFEAAQKWAMFISNFARVRGVSESIDRTKDRSNFDKKNPDVMRNVVTHPVWIVGAAI